MSDFVQIILIKWMKSYTGEHSNFTNKILGYMVEFISASFAIFL